MPDLKGACPYDERSRAARCSGCVQMHGGVTPCIIAWLSQGTGPTRLRTLEVRTPALKAA